MDCRSASIKAGRIHADFNPRQSVRQRFCANASHDVIDSLLLQLPPYVPGITRMPPKLYNAVVGISSVTRVVKLERGSSVIGYRACCV